MLQVVWNKFYRGQVDPLQCYMYTSSKNPVLSGLRIGIGVRLGSWNLSTKITDRAKKQLGKDQAKKKISSPGAHNLCFPIIFHVVLVGSHCPFNRHQVPHFLINYILLILDDFLPKFVKFFILYFGLL